MNEREKKRGRSKILEGTLWGQRVLSALPRGDRSLEQWFEQGGMVLKRDPHGMTAVIELDGRPCFASLYRHKTALRKLFATVTARRARNAFLMGGILRDCDVPVAQPLTCMLLPEGALLLTQKLDTTEHLASDWPKLSLDEQERRLRGAAQTLASLHASAYAHGDAKWQNLVPGRERCFLVDLDRVRYSGVAANAQARDLARFIVSGEEEGLDEKLYALFVQDYLAQTSLQAGQQRDAFMTEVAGGARVFRQRHERRYGIVPRPLV